MTSFLLLAALLLAPKADPAPAVPLNVLAAVASHQVTVTASSQGLGDNNLACTVRDLTPRPLLVRLPPGLHFAAGEDGRQDLLTCQEQLLTLAPQGRATVPMWGFCLEQHDFVANAQTPYTLRGMAGRGLQPLADSLQKYPALAPDYGQMFVWALTDGEPVQDVHVPAAWVRPATNVLRYLQAATERGTGQVRAGHTAMP